MLGGIRSKSGTSEQEQENNMANESDRSVPAEWLMGAKKYSLKSVADRMHYFVLSTCSDDLGLRRWR